MSEKYFSGNITTEEMKRFEKLLAHNAHDGFCFKIEA